MKYHTITAAICIVLLPVAGLWADPLVTGDLTAFYDFSNYVGGDGYTVADGSGNGYNSTIVGNVVQTIGPNGGAGKFWTEGVDVPWLGNEAAAIGLGAATKEEADWNFVDMPVADIFAGGDIPTSNFTLAAWYKTVVHLRIDPDLEANQAIICPRSEDGTWLCHPEIRGRLTPTEDNYRFTIRGYEMTNIGTVEAGKGIADEGPNWEEWTHVAFTYDKDTATMRVYENGDLYDTLSSVNPIDMPADWSQGSRIGLNVDYARQFLGEMDEVYIFSRTLSRSEIKVLADSYTLPGDANSDGCVDVADLGILATNYNMAEECGWADGDFTGDAAVDIDDLGILATNYNMMAAAAVPEPSVPILLWLAALTLAWRRRK